MFKPFTTSARKLVLAAEDEALALGHEDIGPEHLLLGAARCGGPAETLLTRLGITAAAVRSRIAARTPPTFNGTEPEVTLSPDAVWALAAAVRRADGRDDRRVGSAHILVALMPSAAVQAILRACEVTPQSVCAAVERYAQHASADLTHAPSPADDARALLQIVMRSGEVAAWLSHRGVYEDSVLDAFRAVVLHEAPEDLEEPDQPAAGLPAAAAPIGQLTPVPPSPQ